MVAEERHSNPMGTIHGGILCDLADAAMGMAYFSTLEPGESFTTLELKINFLRPFWTGRLVARARVVSRGTHGRHDRVRRRGRRGPPDRESDVDVPDAPRRSRRRSLTHLRHDSVTCPSRWQPPRHVRQEQCAWDDVFGLNEPARVHSVTGTWHARHGWLPPAVGSSCVPKRRAERTAPRAVAISSSLSSSASAAMRVLDVLRLRRADDRRRHARLVQQPRERDLRRRNAARARHLDHAIDDVEVDLRLVERVARRSPSRRASCAARPRACGSRRAARARAGSTAARRRPCRCTAGSSPAPPRGTRGCSGSASRRTASSRARAQSPAPSRTATRTCCSRRCSAPCPTRTTSCNTSIVSSIGVAGSKRWIWYRST